MAPASAVDSMSKARARHANGDDSDSDKDAVRASISHRVSSSNISRRCVTAAVARSPQQTQQQSRLAQAIVAATAHQQQRRAQISRVERYARVRSCASSFTTHLASSCRLGSERAPRSARGEPRTPRRHDDKPAHAGQSSSRRRHHDPRAVRERRNALMKELEECVIRFSFFCGSVLRCCWFLFW